MHVLNSSRTGARPRFKKSPDLPDLNFSAVEPSSDFPPCPVSRKSSVRVFALLVAPYGALFFCFFLAVFNVQERLPFLLSVLATGPPIVSPSSHGIQSRRRGSRDPSILDQTIPSCLSLPIIPSRGRRLSLSPSAFSKPLTLYNIPCVFSLSAPKLYAPFFWFFQSNPLGDFLPFFEGVQSSETTPSTSFLSRVFWNFTFTPSPTSFSRPELVFLGPNARV